MIIAVPYSSINITILYFDNWTIFITTMRMVLFLLLQKYHYVFNCCFDQSINQSNDKDDDGDEPICSCSSNESELVDDEVFEGVIVVISISDSVVLKFEYQADDIEYSV